MLRTLRIYSFNNFQIYPSTLLTIVIMLYIMCWLFFSKLVFCGSQSRTGIVKCCLLFKSSLLLVCLFFKFFWGIAMLIHYVSSISCCKPGAEYEQQRLYALPHQASNIYSPALYRNICQLLIQGDHQNHLEIPGLFPLPRQNLWYAVLYHISVDEEFAGLILFL